MSVVGKRGLVMRIRPEITPLCVAISVTFEAFRLDSPPHTEPEAHRALLNLNDGLVQNPSSTASSIVFSQLDGTFRLDF
jgi:hypothetical protein